jgi:metal-dependent hydrolase (beta-lactamase superfamily II)
MHELNYELEAVEGRINIKIKAIELGNDLCVIVTGGESPHIGCTILSVPRPGLDDKSIISSTESVLNLTGHKDDDALRHAAHLLSSKLNKNVVVTGGIHVSNITEEEISTVIRLLKDLTEKLIIQIKNNY